MKQVINLYCCKIEDVCEPDDRRTYDLVDLNCLLFNHLVYHHVPYTHTYVSLDFFVGPELICKFCMENNFKAKPDYLIIFFFFDHRKRRIGLIRWMLSSRRFRIRPFRLLTGCLNKVQRSDRVYCAPVHPFKYFYISASWIHKE